MPSKPLRLLGEQIVALDGYLATRHMLLFQRFVVTIGLLEHAISNNAKSKALFSVAITTLLHLGSDGMDYAFKGTACNLSKP